MLQHYIYDHTTQTKLVIVFYKTKKS